MPKQFRYYHHGRQVATNEALNECGSLRDGYSLVVSKTMRDNAADTQRITDGTNNPLAGHRPGWRINANDTAARAARARCYDEYIQELTTAWRRGKEVVVPDAPKASGNDAMPVPDIETAYRLYAEEISQAWKTPR